MKQSADKGFRHAAADSRLAEATDWFMRMRAEDAQAEDLAQLQMWLEQDPHNAPAYRKVLNTWEAIGAHSTAPEIVIARRDALEDARRAARHRWSAFELNKGRQKFAIAAAIAGLAIATGLWTYTRPPTYTTAAGERRTLPLDDGSTVDLDASSQVRVAYEDDERLIYLEKGQARFDVAKDPTRPFRVKAGKQTVVALGTAFNVEIVGGNVLVTMIEGQVAVTGTLTPSAESTSLSTKGRGTEGEGHHPVIELKAGEALRVREDGQATRLAKIDVQRATAWQSGKMFFTSEPLSIAAERINRYTKQKIEVDPSVAQLSISGAFNTGDPNAFIEAITAYFPVKAEQPDSSTVRLTAR